MPVEVCPLALERLGCHLSLSLLHIFTDAAGEGKKKDKNRGFFFLQQRSLFNGNSFNSQFLPSPPTSSLPSLCLLFYKPIFLKKGKHYLVSDPQPQTHFSLIAM